MLTAKQHQVFRNKIYKVIFSGIFLVATAITIWQFIPVRKNISLPVDQKIHTDFKRSIAVLPFNDLSPGNDQEYFSDGIMNEITLHLFKIGDLAVTSRTSVMQYKGTVKKASEIARELGVGNILEGSVSKDGNRIRINVQLIDASNDKYLWAEQYERDIKDIIFIQSEVAREVASALNAEISPEILRLIESTPTIYPEAYNLYLEALYEYYTYTFEGKKKAELLCEEAITIDPDFASAYAYLGNIKSAYHWAMKNPRVSSTQEAVAVALPYYEKALEIDPDNIPTHKFMGEMNLYFEWDFDKALKEYEILLRLEPNHFWIDPLFIFGKFEEAYERTEMQIRLDPLNKEAWVYRIYSLYFKNEFDKALEYIEMLTKKDLGSYYVVIGELYLYLGKYEEAVKMVHNYFKNYPDNRPPRTLAILGIAYQFTAQEKKTGEIIYELKSRSKISSVGSPSVYLSKVYAQLGRNDLAFEWLEKAYQDHETDVVGIKNSPLFEPIHNDPRWKAMLDKVGFPD